jgi:DNA-binding NtrC family response regulator
VILLIVPPSVERDEMVSFLEARGFRIELASAGAAQPAGRVFEAAIVDLVSPDALKYLRRHAPNERVPVICFADRRRPNAASDALRLGAADIVARPLRFEEVQAALANVTELQNAPSDAETIADTIGAPIGGPPDGVFGVSPAMQDVIGLVRRIAPSSSGVLIVGERGTGREMVARAIHMRSPRRDGTFFKVACGAATLEELSSLIDDPGAAGRTVYLEDLSELPQALQEFLEWRLRPHTQESGPVDATHRTRVIAGAQPRLFDWIERGLVSRDLVEAIGVVRIDLAPLRQRPQDIPLLAMHFLKEACRLARVPPKTFSRGAFQLLHALPWRGNAAELKSLCERLTVVVPRGVVSLEDVLGNVRFDAADAIGRSDETLRVARERFERDYVTAVVQQNRGRIGAAAKQLGIERTNLYRKLKQLNITVTTSPD